MIRVLFFARTREVLATDSLILEDAGLTLGELRDQLAQKGDDWSECVGRGRALAAVNQALVSDDHAIASGDEVAFFPPVTGG